ncbi:MAG: hypothetical protein ACYC7E_15345 [Armatimonadota bacterium]
MRNVISAQQYTRRHPLIDRMILVKTVPGETLPATLTPGIHGNKTVAASVIK